MVYHTFREGNQSADFLAKLKASSNVEFLRHESSPMNLVHLLQSLMPFYHLLFLK